jgi:hypothetical protein
MVMNTQGRIHQTFYEAFSSWIGAGDPPQSLVCVGVTPNDELVFPAMAVVDYMCVYV